MKKHPSALSSSTNWGDDPTEREAEWRDTLREDRRSTFGDDDYYSVEQLHSPHHNHNDQDAGSSDQAGGFFDSLRAGAKFVCSREAWRTANIMHIFIAFFLYMLANAFVTTSSTLIVIDLCGGDTSEAASLQSYLSAASAGATLVTAALLGVIADRWGRVPCLLISLVGFAVDTGALAAAPLLGMPVWPLYFTRAIGGASSGFYTAGYAYVADISSLSNRSKSFGVFGIAMGLAFLFGPIVAGLLGQINLAFPMLVALGLIAVDFLYVKFIMVESRRVAHQQPLQWQRLNPLRSFGLLLQNYYALCVAATFLIMYLAEEGVFSISIIYIKDKFDWGVLEIGIVTACFGITYFLSQGVLLRFILPWLGDRKSLLLSMFTDSMSTWPYAVVPSGYYIYPLMLLRTVSMMAMPISQGIISKQYSVERQGELMGVLSGVKTITAFFGPLIYGQLLSYFASDDAWPSTNPGYVYYVITANSMVAFVATCIVFLVFPEHKTGYKELAAPQDSDIEDIPSDELSRLVPLKE